MRNSSLIRQGKSCRQPIRNRVGARGGKRDKPSRVNSVVIPKNHDSRDLEWWHPRRSKTALSKVENQIARHCELIVPSTVVVSLQIPGTLETQFRTYLDSCADPMTQRDRVL